MPSILRGISRRSDCISHSFLSTRAVINFCHSNFWASSARTGVHPGIFITSRWQLARGTPCSPSHLQYAPFTGLLSGPCCCCCLALSLLLMIYKFPRHFISFEVDTQNAWQREQKRTGIERERERDGRGAVMCFKLKPNVKTVQTLFRWRSILRTTSGAFTIYSYRQTDRGLFPCDREMILSNLFYSCAEVFIILKSAEQCHD